MKLLILVFTFLVNQVAFSQEMVVRNPEVQSTSVTLSIKNFTCTKGPFSLAWVELIPNNHLGSLRQSNIFSITNQNMMTRDECTEFIKNLNSLVDQSGNIKVQAQIITRSVLKLTGVLSSKCEGAQQEVVTINISDIKLGESIALSEGPLDCPNGVSANLVNTRDFVLQVLHENGVPTKVEF